MKLKENLTKEDKKMLNSMFLRSFTIFASRAGAVKYHAPGFEYTLLPAIRRYYKSDEEQIEALKRHTTWYNCTQWVGTFILGLVASMEKEKSENPDFDPQSIIAIKSALMGPLSGIGDSIFWGILRVIAAGIGISLAQKGSLLGPIVFLILFNVPTIICRYYMTYIGFSVGSSFIEKMYHSGGMQLLTKAASILGLLMMGSMTATNVKFATKLAIHVSGGALKIQTYLDQLFKGIVPLGVTLLCFYLLKKKVNINIVMFGLLFVAIVLGLLGVV